jgi:hypothetical protein
MAWCDQIKTGMNNHSNKLNLKEKFNEEFEFLKIQKTYDLRLS